VLRLAQLSKTSILAYRTNNVLADVRISRQACGMYENLSKIIHISDAGTEACLNACRDYRSGTGLGTVVFDRLTYRVPPLFIASRDLSCRL